MLSPKTLLSFAVLFVALVAVKSQQCPELYQRYTTQHTYCKPANRSCTIYKRGVSEKDKQFILKIHNDYRSRIATGQEHYGGGMPQAADMMEMVWDDELAATAQKLTETCVYGHDCNNCRRAMKFSVGQNIGHSSRTGPDYRPDADWMWFLKGLYDEVQSPAFHKRIVRSYVPGPHSQTLQYGHFTQLIWAKSWTVGCGWSLHSDGEWTRSYFACNYGPGGNAEGEEIYKEGSSCSACPENSCCGSSCRRHGISSKYSGLCKVINEDDAPEGKGGSPDNIFFCNFHDQPDCATSGTGSWRKYSTRGGNWIGTVLNGGESTTLNFNKPFRTKSSDGRFCFKLVVRRGPNRAGTAFGSSGVSSFSGPRGNPLTLDLSEFPEDFWQQFIPNSYSLGIFRDDIKFSFTFTVPRGKPAQFIEIKEVSAKSGRCS